jgi:hypothetical protein
MKSDFEWHSGDGDDTPQESTESFPPRKKHLSRPVLFLLVVISVVIGAWLLLRNVGEYVAATEINAEDEVRSSLDFLIDAQRDADLELFAGLLSGRDASWARTQISLADAGLLLDRNQFGLKLLGESAESVDRIELSPDLRQATATRIFNYSRVDGEEAISLAQVFDFRQGSDRWLFSPPDEDYWGGEEQVKGRFVTAIFPARNSEFHRRLAADLEGTITSTCLVILGNCQQELHMTVIFSRDPEVQLQGTGLATQRLNTGEFLLPAIGLFGLPTDESSYRAVYRAYATQIVESLISEHLDATCCAKPVFYRALVNVQLNRLGLRERKRVSLDSLNVTLNQLNDLWNLDSDAETISGQDKALIQSFVNFLTEDKLPEAVISMQEGLFQSDSFWEWLRRFHTLSFESIENLESTWVEFIHDYGNE